MCQLVCVCAWVCVYDLVYVILDTYEMRLEKWKVAEAEA